MKNFKLLSLSMIIASSLFFVQCTTDPIAGPAGEDGKDGIDGVSGTAECASCHNVATSEAVHASYLFSMHYNESLHERTVDGEVVMLPTSQYANRGTCTACHTSDGFIDNATIGSVTGEAYPGTQTITCNTCHDKHTSFDFENDEKDFALRVLDPVTLVSDESYTMDYGDDNRSSHTCTTCHQPRSTIESAIQEDGTVRVSSRFGPHHGPQSTLLEGIQGGEIAGSEAYDAPGSARHRSGSSCTSCHMGESGGNIEGNHTLFPAETTCVKCHTSGVPEEVAGLAENMETLLAQLVDIGILTEDGSPVSGNYPLIQAQAAWNYILIMEDSSNGVHNPNYAKALIKNSIEALAAN